MLQPMIYQSQINLSRVCGRVRGLAMSAQDVFFDRGQ
jgi:hypothetical protein